GGGRRHQAPQDGTDEGHDRGLGKRQPESDEQRPGSEDEEPDPEARPEDKQIESPEDPQPMRDRFDAPFRRPSHPEHREAKPSAYISDWRRRAAVHLFVFANLLYECFNAVTSGSSFPARKLMRAPPPVLTSSIRSESPSCSPAPTVCPPPTIYKPSASAT